MIRLSFDALFEEKDAIEIKATIFPDKTSQVWKLPTEAINKLEKAMSCTIRWDFESEAEVMHVAQLFTLLQTFTLYINLDMPYLPYARQDKRVSNDTTFALHTFARMINAMGFNEIYILDGHSHRASMIDNLIDTPPRSYVVKAIEATKADTILFPDAGAKTRYEALLSGRVRNTVYAEKEREQSTGLIKGIKIYGKVKGRRILIVDDLCDGGMTFKMVAEQALKEGAKEVHLYVTHGLFSQGTDTLRKSGIKRIFTYRGEIPV